MNDHNITTLGQRLTDVRKRRGWSQRELARTSGVSLSLIRKIEQGERDNMRLETLRRLAMALKVPTSSFVRRPETEDADAHTAESWEDVRRALYGQLPQPDGDDEPSGNGILALLNAAKPQLAANQFSEIRVMLPGLIRDADALNGEGRPVRSRVLNLTAWLLTQTRQWDAAATAAQLAADAAADRLDAAASVNTACWSLLRQGMLGDARELAVRYADEIEPKFSKATVRELAIWGRLLLNLTNAAIRDNRPGEAEDAIRLARAAADRIGHEVTSDASTTRTFGPVTVAQIASENAAINGDPHQVLEIAAAIPPGILHPASASRCRHRLDVAHAYTLLRQYGDALDILRELHRDAPEWLIQQRYARDILGRIISRRRTLSSEMLELADAINLAI